MESKGNSSRLVEGASWLVRLRWIAIIGVIIATRFSAGVMDIAIKEIPVYVLASFLLLFNILSFLGIRFIRQKEQNTRFITAKRILYFQFCSDLVVLTCLLHFSGGVENPFIIYYIFHMIIGGILLSPKECFAVTSFALACVGALAFLEYHEIIPHFHLEGLFTHCYYQNKVYLIATGFIFVTTSYMVIYMTTSISSKLRKQEQAYRLANIELENQDKIKNEYVLRLTHDIKGHLAAIQNVLQAAMLSKNEEDKRDFVTRAFKRIRRLMDFVKDLLKLTSLRLQNKPEMTEFAIEESIGKVIQEAKNICPKNIIIRAETGESENLLFGNRLSMEEALSNIISNAIKYSPEGGTISVMGRRMDTQFFIRIKDEGIGIPGKDLKLIFNEFYQGSNIGSVGKEGYGFGLSFVKQIVEMHQGKINIESEEGKGTEFILQFPLSEQGRKKIPKKWIL